MPAGRPGVNTAQAVRDERADQDRAVMYGKIKDLEAIVWKARAKFA